MFRRPIETTALIRSWVSLGITACKGNQDWRAQGDFFRTLGPIQLSNGAFALASPDGSFHYPLVR